MSPEDLEGVLDDLGEVIDVDRDRKVATFVDGWLKVDDVATGGVLPGTFGTSYPDSDHPEVRARVERDQATLLVGLRDWHLLVREAERRRDAAEAALDPRTGAPGANESTWFNATDAARAGSKFFTFSKSDMASSRSPLCAYNFPRRE